MKDDRLSRRSSKFKLMDIRTVDSPCREYSFASQNKVNEEEE
jgi:hypothetical protein